MARTLRTRCPACAAPTFSTEGLRRSLCGRCGHSQLLPDTRGIPFAELACLGCGTVMERNLWPGARCCPCCGRGFLPSTLDPPARYLVREQVGRERAGMLLSQARFGDLGELQLVLAPTWLYRAAEFAWLIGNERDDPNDGSIRRRSRKSDAPVPTLGAPRGGSLAYTKHDFGRSLREIVVDPATEQLGWKPYAQHMDATTLAPLEPAEMGEVTRVLRAGLSAAEALEQCRARVAATPLVPERSFYKFFEWREIVRELLVIVYHPYWVASDGDDPVVLDGVAGTQIDPPKASQISLAFVSAETIRDERPPPIVCASCGGDPGVVPEGATLIRCAPCGVMLSLGPAGTRVLEATVVEAHKVAEAGEDAAIVHLPVWRFPVTVHNEEEGVEIRTCAEWKRFQKQVEVEASPEDEARPLYFHVVAAGPALTPRLDPLSLALNRVQPRLEAVEEQPPDRARCLPGRLEADAATRMAFGLYVSELKDLALKAIDRLKRARVETGGPELILVPCVEDRNELHDLIVGVSQQSAPLR